MLFDDIMMTLTEILYTGVVLKDIMLVILKWFKGEVGTVNHV